MDFGIRGKIALVTAASKGLGRGSAEALSAEGCRVAICARTRADVERAAREISARSGHAVVPFVADPSRANPPEAVRAFGWDTLKLQTPLQTDRYRGMFRGRALGAALGPVLVATSAPEASEAPWQRAVLEAITVDGARTGNGADDPYVASDSSAYITGDQIERYRGASPADILKGAPGVYSGQSRASGGIDANIRGLQGQGRVPVTVDGAQNSTAMYRGYQGIANSTFIDPDFIGGVAVEKGPSTSATGPALRKLSTAVRSSASRLTVCMNAGLR